jgi:O-antigen/teichoic acid export membrane protein
MKFISNFYNRFANDSLYRNSIYLMLSTAVMAFLGFFFWIISARLFEPDEVGIAATLISVMTLISSLSLLGLGNSLIRYLPTSERKTQKINTAFILVGLTSIFISILVLLFLKTLSPKLLFVRNNRLFAVCFILFVVCSSLNAIAEAVFIAYRSSHYVLMNNSVLALVKLILPLILITLGAYGIFMSVGLATVIAFVLSLMLLVCKFDYLIELTINKDIVRRMARFALGNYVGNIFGILPGTFVPIMVVTQLGAAKGAFFYMPLMITSLLNIVPSATARSLFAEASHAEDRLNYYFWRAMGNVFLLLVPAVVFVIVFADIGLYFFGADYATEGTSVLRIMALASLVGAVNYLGDSMLNIKRYVGMYIVMNMLNAIIIVVLVYLLAPRGLIWVAYAGFIGQVITLIVYIPIMRQLLIQTYNTN